METKNLKDFIELVLEAEFKGTSWKHNVNETSKGFNFHCPFCGDTDSQRKKPRGNIYLSSKTFKCFNAGCMEWLPLRKFISMMAQKHSIDVVNLDFDFTEGPAFNSKLTTKLDKNNTILDYLEDIDVLPELPTIDYIADRFSLIPIKRMSAGSKAIQFLDKRKVLDLPGAHDSIFSDTLDDKIYIFNYHKITGKLISFSTRKIEVKSYKIYTFSDILKAMNINMEIKDLDVVNMIGNYYNILNINFDEKVRITEGQIDSMFLFNAAAVQGVSKVNFMHDYIDQENIKIFFDRDIAGVDTSLKDLKNGYSVFMWSLLIDRLKKIYYNEIPRIMKIKDVNDLYLFLYSKSRLDMKQFNEITDRYYTTSLYDIFNL